MVRSEFGVFAGFIEAICATFGKDPSEALLEGYWIGLSDLTLDQMKAATHASLNQCKFMPKPAELRELVEAGVETAAISAWPEVMKLAGRSSSEHSDPVAKEAIRLMGGGKRLGQMDQQELEVWGRKEFERIYQDVAEQKKHPERMKLGYPHESIRHLIGPIADGKKI